MKHSQPLNSGASSHKFNISLSAHWVSQVPNHSVPTAGAVSYTSPHLPALLGMGRRRCLQAPSGFERKDCIYTSLVRGSQFVLCKPLRMLGIREQSPKKLLFWYVRWMGWCCLVVNHHLRTSWSIWQTFDRGLAVS